MTINTGGGAYVAGGVQSQNFAGRDLIINYIIDGLHQLPANPTNNFQNFFDEYLGTLYNHVPFGGRQTKIDELNNWFNDPTAPPYYLMTAEAGRGKSALVCRWMEQLRTLRDDVEVIFIPISIRFETATQDTVFTAMAARLAKVQGEQLKLVAISNTYWQNVCQEYLKRPLPNGKQLLIILDGLDETVGWDIGAGFFSTNPRTGLRVLVTARLRVGETTPHGWSATLGWNEHLAQMSMLPPLTRAGVEEALLSMGDPLGQLANKQEVTEQLYRLSEEGDPLLVKLYVDALFAKGDQAAFLHAEDLFHLKPGLDEYFNQWWEAQREQWKKEGRDPEYDNANLRLLLDALSAALGPLTLDDLAALKLEFESSRLVRTLLKLLERWVIGDGKEQGYVFSHSRLGYYFWEQLNRQEQVEWDRRFCDWGADTLDKLNIDQLDPKAAPVYLLRHYVAHLQRSNVSAEAFYAVVSNGWRKAWEWLDISYSGFLNDLEQAWSAAVSEGTSALGQLIRTALFMSSAITINTNIRDDLLVSCLDAKVITPTNALALARCKIDTNERIATLLAVSKHLPIDLQKTALVEALTTIGEIADKNNRFDELAKLAAHLTSDVSDVAEKVWAILNEDLYHRAIMLGKWAQTLPPDQQRPIFIEALNTVSTINNKGEYFAALLYIARCITPVTNDFSEKILAMAQTIFQKSNDSYTYVEVLCAVADQVNTDRKSGILLSALEVACSVEVEAIRIRSLGIISSRLPVQQQESVLQEMLEVARSILNEFIRADELAVIATYTPPQLAEIINLILTEAHNIANENIRFKALIQIIHHFRISDAELFREILRLDRTGYIESEQGDGLTKIIDLLPLDASLLLEEVYHTIRTFSARDVRASLLAKLAQRLSSTNAELLQKIFDDIRSIDWSSERIEALIAISKQVPPDEKQNLIDEVLTFASNDPDSYYPDLLFTVIDNLTGKRRQEVLEQLLSLIDRESDCQRRSRHLLEVAKQLSSIEQYAVLEKAWKAVRLIGDSEQYLEILLAMLEVTSTHTNLELSNVTDNESVPSELVSKVIEIIRQVDDMFVRADQLSRVAKLLPLRQQQDLETEALAIALAIPGAQRSLTDFNLKINRSITATNHFEYSLMKWVSLKAKSSMGIHTALNAPLPHVRHSQSLRKQSMFSSVESLGQYNKDRQIFHEVLNTISVCTKQPLSSEQRLIAWYYTLVKAQSIGAEQTRLDALAFIAASIMASDIDIACKLLEEVSYFRHYIKSTDILSTLSPYWDDICRFHRCSEIDLITKTLREFAGTRRIILLNAIKALLPIITRLGGKQAIQETAQAILDVAEW